MLGMIWNYEFFTKEAFLQSENEQTFAEICFDLTEKFINSQNSVTVWKLREFTLTHFWLKFRESNSFTKEITK